MADDLDVLRPYGAHLPATYANAFHVAVGPHMARLVFGESFPDQAVVRWDTAVSLSTEDALGLADLIYKMHGEMEKRKQAASLQVQDNA
jgi:hypothetical protein